MLHSLTTSRSLLGPEWPRRAEGSQESGAGERGVILWSHPPPRRTDQDRTGIVASGGDQPAVGRGESWVMEEQEGSGGLGRGGVRIQDCLFGEGLGAGGKKPALQGRLKPPLWPHLSPEGSRIRGRDRTGWDGLGNPLCYSWKGGQLPSGDEGPPCGGKSVLGTENAG